MDSNVSGCVDKYENKVTSAVKDTNAATIARKNRIREASIKANNKINELEKHAIESIQDMPEHQQSQVTNVWENASNTITELSGNVLGTVCQMIDESNPDVVSTVGTLFASARATLDITFVHLHSIINEQINFVNRAIMDRMWHRM